MDDLSSSTLAYDSDGDTTILDPFVESRSEGLWRAHPVNGMTLILPISMAILGISGCRLAAVSVHDKSFKTHM